MKYYTKKLADERLRQMYESAPPRIQQYLQAEIDFVRESLRRGQIVLDLGCGYGRIMKPLAQNCREIVGIDTAMSSLLLAGDYLDPIENVGLAVMDAAALGFADGIFDVVMCLQNGISAFHIDPKLLLSEMWRVSTTSGRLILTSYSEHFWEERLAWFEAQARDGYVGQIDYERTRFGKIVCKDGFTATTFSADDFERLTRDLLAEVDIREIDGSCLVCTIVKRS